MIVHVRIRTIIIFFLILINLEVAPGTNQGFIKMEQLNKDFFYLDGNDKKGPFSIEQLKTVGLIGLMPDTFVWSEGFEDWKPVKNIEELKSLMVQLERSMKNIKLFAIIGLISGLTIGLFAFGSNPFGLRVFITFFFGMIGLLVGLTLPSLGRTYKWTCQKFGRIISFVNPLKGEPWRLFLFVIFGMYFYAFLVYVIILPAPIVSIKRYFTIKKQLG